MEGGFGLIVGKEHKIREGGSKSFQVEMRIDNKRCLKVFWDEM